MEPPRDPMTPPPDPKEQAPGIEVMFTGFIFGAFGVAFVINGSPWGLVLILFGIGILGVGAWLYYDYFRDTRSLRKYVLMSKTPGLLEGRQRLEEQEAQQRHERELRQQELTVQLQAAALSLQTDLSKMIIASQKANAFEEMFEVFEQAQAAVDRLTEAAQAGQVADKAEAQRMVNDASKAVKQVTNRLIDRIGR